ncbi:alpha/beta fold hydrolase [Catellatospora tritici]|uniref:alpha/beta fold hydrolase n=1 Tax=Catellatospora tritici TaxID=2851566 RepID=UPI001C2DA8C6|nr:alpha/beta fold hydrolase [Catellatospora tritici]MBV1853810.1 alpha/beta fold hydrolase [Catellatospora tritici]
MTHATLHDGAHLPLHLTGEGPDLLLAVNPDPVEGPQADAMRAWGADPELGRDLIAGLADRFRVIAFDYEGHVQRHPKPDTLTPDNVAADLLAVADAAGAQRFAYYGYSWLALAGLQLALRTDRLAALVMGGYPPIDGPYRQMLAVTTAAHAKATAPAAPPGEVVAGDWATVQVTSTEAQTRQFVTLYQALRTFDDRAAQARVHCPRLCVVGSADTIAYGPDWGGVVVDIAGPLLRERAAAEAHGWDVAVLDGLDHMGAMQAAAVLPVLRPWLTRAVG